MAWPTHPSQLPQGRVLKHGVHMSYHPSSFYTSDPGPADASHSGSIPAGIASNTSKVFGPYEPPLEGCQADRFLAKLRKQWDGLDPEMTGRIGLLEYGYYPEEIGVPPDGSNVYSAKLNLFESAIELGKWVAQLLKTRGIVDRKRLLRIAENAKLIQEKTYRDMENLQSTGVLLGVPKAGFDAALKAQQSRIREIPSRGASGRHALSPLNGPRHPLSLICQYLGQALNVGAREGQNPETLDLMPGLQAIFKTAETRYQEHLRIETEAAKAVALAARTKAPKVHKDLFEALQRRSGLLQ